VFILQTDSSV